MRHFMQNLGKAMLLPIVALPAAGILFRISAEDLPDWPLVQAAGAIFDNIDILIAIVIAMGLATTKDRGIRALGGYLAISILSEGVCIMNPDVDLSVFGGVVSGLVGGFIYNRGKD